MKVNTKTIRNKGRRRESLKVDILRAINITMLIIVEVTNIRTKNKWFKSY